MGKRKVKDLKPYPGNPRKMSKEEMDKLKESISEFGLVDPLIINKSNEVIGGNQRLKAIKSLGMKEANVVVVDLSKSKEKALNMALNKISGEWDDDLLKTFIDDIEPIDLELTGFSDEEISLIDDTDIEVQEDEYQEPEDIKVSVKRGDIYQLGNHRLMCGDSTVKEDVEKLMNGEKAGIILTDPPYGIKVVNKKGFVGKSNVAKTKRYNSFIGDANFNFQPVWEVIKNLSKKVIIFGGNYFTDILEPTTSWIVWDKRAGKHSWYSDCELAWTNLGMPARIYQYVWQGMIREGEKEDRKHPTQKPVGLLSDILKDYSKKDDIVLDLFGGSGSTLIASEQLGRKCYMMEIDPYYCQVIIERWEALTGKKAQKLNG